MPKTTPKPAEPIEKKWTSKEPPRYVRCDLTKDQKEKLLLWIEETELVDLVEWWEKKVERGHTVTIKSQEVGYQASITGVTDGSGHVGLSLISRASGPLKSLYSLMYKDTVVLEGVWPATGRLDDLDI